MRDACTKPWDFIDPIENKKLRELRAGMRRAMGNAVCLRMIYCGWPKVRIIEPNGRHRHFSAPITIPELLQLYPHHCVHHVSGSILSVNDELQGGNTYLLLPMPGLFPGSSSSSNPQPCFCLLHKDQQHQETAIGRGGLSIWKPRAQLTTQRDSNPRRFSRTSAQKHHGSNKTVTRARAWQPSLDVISENNTLLQTKNEQPVKNTEKKTAKPRISTFNHNACNGERPRNLQVMVPSGFLF